MIELHPKTENSNSKSFLSEIAFGNDPEGNITEGLGYVSQIFLPKKMGNDATPCLAVSFT